MILVLAACSDERPRADGGSPTVSVHPAGILDPASEDFHVRELARRNWDFAVCAKCHGNDFAGGLARSSCLGCHAAGPTACTTCHGDGPTTNAHVVHREVGQLACGECHVVPATWDAEAHLRRGGVADPPPAEVTFGARAADDRSARSRRAGELPRRALHQRLLPRRRVARRRWHRDPAAVGRSSGAGRLQSLPRRAAAEPRAGSVRDLSPCCGAAYRRDRAGRPRCRVRWLPRRRDVPRATVGSGGQPVHHRDRRRRASRAPRGAVGAARADRLRHVSSRPARRRRPRAHRLAATGGGHRGARLGPRHGDLRERVVPRRGAAGVDDHG